MILRRWLQRLLGKPTVHAAEPLDGAEAIADAADRELVLQFIPSLSAVLLNAERKKGAPLLETEVVEIRDKASVMAVTRGMARDVDARRGYIDIDPEDCWRQYLQMRETLKGTSHE